MTPGWVTAIQILSPIVTAIVALAVRGVVISAVEARIQVRVEDICARFERRFQRLEHLVDSPKVSDRQQAILSSLATLERRLDRLHPPE